MMQKELKYGLWCVCALFTLMAACTPEEGDEGSNTDTENSVIEDDTNFPLEDLDVLVGDHPVSQGKELARFDSKYDLELPASFNVVETLSPVRNQRSRGVCSIFSTVGLMEHLYIKAGMQDPDFSEQYLQWSTKVQGGYFPHTGGSSGNANISTINRYGIPEESAWPYEGSKWSASDDPECGKMGDDYEVPTKCFTNGDPDQMTRDAKKYFLPRREYVSSYTNSLKTYMFKNKRAVVSGMDFYYQSWSHGGSSLGLNSGNKSAGAVVYPGPEAIKEGKEKPAGHSILLVGWDDEKTFPRLGTDGKPLLDDNGEVVYDKGFFLFKNSWGTGGSWGSKNEFGPGFGWLSYKYVQEFGRSVSAAEPELEEPVVEICGDGLDNDSNGLIDCEDSACSANMTCSAMAQTATFSSMTGEVAIPDNDPMGVQDKISVELDERIALVKVTLDVEHSWIGDLDILVISPEGDVAVISENDGSAGKSIKDTFVLEDFNGENAKGDWVIDIADNSRQDDGKLLGWSIEITY